jgi:hypothetical protein
MIDLHQGFSGNEMREMKPGVGSVAFAQIDVWTAALKGQWWLAVRRQVQTWQLIGRVAWAALQSS